MPTYDYQCRKCGHTLEYFQSFSEPDLKKCPKCGGKLNRLIGMGAGIIFKGSGFYETDYRSSEYKEKAKREVDSASSEELSDKKDSKKVDSSSTSCDSSNCSLESK